MSSRKEREGGWQSKYPDIEIRFGQNNLCFASEPTESHHSYFSFHPGNGQWRICYTAIILLKQMETDTQGKKSRKCHQCKNLHFSTNNVKDIPYEEEMEVLKGVGKKWSSENL